MTIQKLLKEFPEYRPTVYAVDMDNKITPHFTYYDRIELEAMYLKKINSEKMQLQLFI